MIKLERLFKNIDLDPKNNAFDFLRLFFAFLVLYSHSWRADSGFNFWYNPYIAVDDIFPNYLGIGIIAVYGFFIVSGYLITGSIIHSKNITEYFTKRFLRIYPAFITCLVVTAFFFMPIMFFIQYGTFKGFFHNYGIEAWYYILNNSGIVIKSSNGFTELYNFTTYKDINGPLWSLIVEVKAYILLAIFSVLGLVKRKWPIVVFSVALWIMYILSTFNPDSRIIQNRLFETYTYPVLFCYFFVGSSFYLFQKYIKYNFGLFLVALTSIIIFCFLNLFPVVAPLAGTYIVLYLAATLPIRKLSHKIGDLSYGVYIYAWPIQQVLVKAGLNNNYFLDTVLTIIFSLSLAFLSWNFIEKRFIRRTQKPILDLENKTELQTI